MRKLSSHYLMLATSDLDYKVLYEQGQLEIINLKNQLEQLKKMIFGSKNERFVPNDKNNPQLALDITAETVAACSLVNAQKITFTREQKKIEQKLLQHPGRILQSYLTKFLKINLRS